MRNFIVLFLLLIIFILPAFAENKKENINNDINIAFAIDKNYSLFTMLTINSMMKSKNPETKYRFHILEDNLTNKQKKEIANFVHKNNADILFYHVSTESYDKEKHIYNHLTRITPIGMARILLPSVMPKEFERVLYLDADILVVGDLKELYNTDLGEYYIGMIRNHSPQDSELFKFGENYFNSGVILMDLDKLRKNKIEEKMITYLKENWQNFEFTDKKTYGLNKKFKYPDQDLINLILRDKIKILDPKWNIQDKGSKLISEKNFKGIIHYIGRKKPWLLKNTTLDAYLLYYKNWYNSPFAIYIPIYWYKSKHLDKIAVYKNIVKFYKN